MASGILYLDSSQEKSVTRALNRHGHVRHVPDINEAMFLMAEHDFDYFFVDADTPQARAFVLHLRHDPQLLPPKAVVLLTRNDDEDCEAWQVDAFITKSRVSSDVPYVFSHLKSPPVEAASVLRIAPSDVSEKPPEALSGVLRGRRRERDIPDGETRSSGEDSVEVAEEDSMDPFAGVAGLRRRKEATAERSKVNVRTGKAPFKALALIFLLAAVGLWLFTLGPLASSSRRGADKPGSKSVEAGTSKADSKAVGEVVSTEPDLDSDADNRAVPGLTLEPASTQPVQPAAAATSSPGEPDTGQPGSETPSGYRAPAPVPETPPVNRPPAASISGPTQVVHGDTATFTASASDSDGDSVSLSWTTKNMCWSTPGLFSVTVTATDSRGASSTSSKSVRVI